MKWVVKAVVEIYRMSRIQQCCACVAVLIGRGRNGRLEAARARLLWMEVAVAHLVVASVNVLLVGESVT